MANPYNLRSLYSNIKKIMEDRGAAEESKRLSRFTASHESCRTNDAHVWRTQNESSAITSDLAPPLCLAALLHRPPMLLQTVDFCIAEVE
jgi:hypothetical protein